ncbi:MAG: protein kinase [Myxococcota bacterium]|nr:protein kinase [Myxococcota bacterium]
MGSSSVDPYLGKQLVKNFTLRRNLGSGEIGVVYEATNEDASRRVAVKVLHPDVAEAHGTDLLRWAKRAAQIRHAKVASILGANRLPDGTTFIVTEFVEGETLMAVLQRHGPLEPPRAADILFQLCSALAPIHRAGRPHANLKPENVFIAPTDSGRDFIKIVDVGSPAIFGAHHLSGEREVVGAAKYFSPEQANGESVGLPSDQFTLGVVGYLLVTGALPFFGATPDQLLDAIVTGAHKPINERAPHVPIEFADIIHRCLAKQAIDRYPDLRTLATALAKVIKAGAKVDSGATQNRREVQESAAPTIMAEAIDISADYDASMDEASVDPDRTMVLSIPAQIQDYLEDSIAPEPIVQDVPKPLSFTGELNDDDISSAIEESMNAMPGVEAVSPNTPAQAEPSEPNQSAVDGGGLDDDLANALADALASEDDARAVGGAAVPPPAPDVLPPLETPIIETAPRQSEPKPSPSTTMAAPDQSISAPPASDLAMPSAMGSTKSSVSGSLLPEDLISAIGSDLADVGPTPQAASHAEVAPVATIADFDQVKDMSEKAKKSRLKSRGLGGVGPSGISRPWMVGLLFVVLVIAALTARIVQNEAEREEEQARIAEQRKQLAEREKAKKFANQVVTAIMTSLPSGAEVFLGEESLGTTPVKVSLRRSETKNFTVKLGGYEPVEHRLVGTTVTPGEPVTKVEIRLKLLGTEDGTASDGRQKDAAVKAVKDSQIGQPAAAKTMKAPSTANRPAGKSVTKPRRKAKRVKRSTATKTPVRKAKRQSTRKRVKPPSRKPAKKAPKADELENPFD